MNALQASLSEGTTRDRLINVARRIMKSDADSEDAAHDAIVHALSHAQDFRAEAQASTWMHRIAVNTALMARRGAGRRVRHMGTLAADAHSNMASPALPHGFRDPESRLLEAIDRHKLRLAVSQLPHSYRELVERCMYQEQTPSEAARAMGLTVAAVRTRLVRARAQLEEKMRTSDRWRRAA